MRGPVVVVVLDAAAVVVVVGTAPPRRPMRGHVDVSKSDREPAEARKTTRLGRVEGGDIDPKC